MKKTTKQIIGVMSSAAFVAVSIVPAFAVDASATATATVGVKAQVQADKTALKDADQAKRTALQTTAKEDRTSMEISNKAKIETMKVDVAALKASGATADEIKAKVDAVRASNQADREKFKTDLAQMRLTLKADIQAQIASFKEGKKIKLSDAAKVQVEQRLNTAFGKITAAVNRLAQFDTKVSGEIAVRKSKGADTSSAEAALELARRSLEVTKVKVDAVNTAVTASLDSSAGASKEAIRSVINDAVESIKTTKSSYQDVISALPAMKASADVNVEASTTAN